MNDLKEEVVKEREKICAVLQESIEKQMFDHPIHSTLSDIFLNKDNNLCVVEKLPDEYQAYYDRDIGNNNSVLCYDGYAEKIVYSEDQRTQVDCFIMKPSVEVSVEDIMVSMAEDDKESSVDVFVEEGSSLIIESWRERFYSYISKIYTEAKKYMKCFDIEEWDKAVNKWTKKGFDNAVAMNLKDVPFGMLRNLSHKDMKSIHNVWFVNYLGFWLPHRGLFEVLPFMEGDDLFFYVVSVFNIVLDTNHMFWVK